MPSLIDLHIHSQFSDGQFDIKQLVELSRTNGVGLISITDHDDIRSSLELKNNSDIKVIEYVNGVELSSYIKLNGKIIRLHILGYGYDEENEELKCRLLEKRNLRTYVNKEYLVKLIHEFPYLSNDLLEKIQCDKYIRLSRLIEAYLNNKELSNDQLNDVKKYLDSNRPIYQGYEFDALESLQIIRNAKGYPVLAHPYQYRLNVKEEIALLKLLKENGLVGLEKYHSGDTPNGMLLQEMMCNKFNLEWTLGSDFHEDHDDFGNQIGYGKNNNLCKSSCSLIKTLRRDGKVLKR